MQLHWVEHISILSTCGVRLLTDGLYSEKTSNVEQQNPFVKKYIQNCCQMTARINGRY